MFINASLIVQMIVFLALVGFTMKYVWPPIVKALDERAAKIKDGLSAADKAKAELTNANKRVEEQLQTARKDGMPNKTPTPVAQRPPSNSERTSGMPSMRT